MKQRDLVGRSVISVFCAVMAGVFFSAGTLFASPTASAPNGNVASPLFQDSRSDTKSGPLTISNTLTATTLTTSGTFTTNYLCLPNGGCKNSWPNLSQPSWTLQNVINAGSSANGASMNVGGIFLNGAYKSSWQTSFAIGGTYGTTYGVGSQCPQGYYLWEVNYNNSGYVGSFVCKNMTFN